jgi:hypothetical protein
VAIVRVWAMIAMRLCGNRTRLGDDCAADCLTFDDLSRLGDDCRVLNDDCNL